MDSRIDINKNQILVFTSPCALPAWRFVLHGFVVVNQKGKLTRFDVLHKRGKDGSHVFTNQFEATKGLPIIWPFKNLSYRSKLRQVIDDPSEDKIKKILELKGDSALYPFWNQYQFLGYNCNTFVRWILDYIGEETKLPISCFGK